ncbi:MAG TPA: alpha/beta hydrolase [Salinisphaeraceae bacterium]|nr:alpha/beta hydrolase [Salinisphaeraceae bacterium]
MTITTDELFADIAGGQVFVRRWTPAKAHHCPIVLLHDSLGCVGLWRDFPAALAAATSRRVIAYDRLGFGKSSPLAKRPAPTFIADEARLHLPAVMAALAVDAYIPFGHSVGGGMALLAATMADNKCAAVITAAAQAFVEERTRAGIRAAKQNFADAAQFARLRKWHGERAAWVLDAWTEVWLAPEFRDWTLVPLLPQVRCPVLAIHGADDEYGSSAFAQCITDGVRGPAQMALLPDCGHVPHHEHRDQVLELVAAFLHVQALP